jgi:thiol-disulfide isomerase/thioredoxin
MLKLLKKLIYIKEILLFLFLVSLYNDLSAGIVDIKFEGNFSKKFDIQIFKHKNIQESEIIKKVNISDSTSISYDLDNNKEEYYTFSDGKKGWEILIKPNEKYTLYYDLTFKSWSKLQIENKNLIFYKFKENEIELNTSVGDSAVFMKNLFDTMKTWGLVPTGSQKKLNSDEIELYKTFYHLFYNTVRGRKLFKINNSNKESVHFTVNKWVNIEEIDIDKGSKIDFFVLRNLVISNNDSIFTQKRNEKLDFEYVIDCGLMWVNKLPYNENLKTYLFGDFYQLFSNFQLKYNEEAINKLNKFITLNPESRHIDFIKKSIFQQSSKIKLNIKAKNLNGENLDLSLIEENLIFVDFWATWCSPCLVENPYIEKWKTLYKGKVSFIKISIDSDGEKWENFIRTKESDNKNNFLIESDFLKSVIDIYGLNAIPKYFIVNNKGEIMDLTPPRPSSSDFQAYIENILN